jgi:pilus assembly protein Flp/PilA
MINNALLQLSVRIRLLRDAAAEHERDRGATAVEYALLVTLIAIVVIAGATALGLSINGKFNDASTAINNKPAAP